MLRSIHVCLRTACVLGCLIATACTHASDSDTAKGGAPQHPASAGGYGSQASARNRPSHPSDGWRLADIAVARLGGPAAPSAPQVTGVSTVEGYGLVVYQIGPSTQELLCLKEGDKWRPLGTNAYFPNGRGLVHFGLDPGLANRLIAGLKPPPTQ